MAWVVMTLKRFSEETRRKMSDSAKKRCNAEWRKMRAELQGTKLPIEKVKELYESGLTQEEVGKILGCSQKVICKFMKRHGIKARPSANNLPKKYGANNPAWRGGKNIHGGYVRIRTPKDCLSSGDSNGYIREHDYIMEKHIGRPLQKGEVVHHINGIKTDNRIENLMLLTNSEHMKVHSEARKRGDANA